MLGRWQEAIESYERAIAIDPSRHDLWTLKGDLCCKLDRFEEAIECHDAALERYPDEILGWEYRGFALASLGRHEEALQSYDKHIAVFPQSSAAWYYKGNSLCHTGDFEAAIHCYDKAIELDPYYSGSWLNKGNCLARLGKSGWSEVALSCYEGAAVRANPPEALGWYNMALVQERLGRNRDAIRSYEKFVAAAPSHLNASAAHERVQNLKSKRE